MLAVVTDNGTKITVDLGQATLPSGWTEHQASFFFQSQWWILVDQTGYSFNTSRTQFEFIGSSIPDYIDGNWNNSTSVVVTLRGNDGDDTLLGGLAADSIVGGNEDDEIEGRSGLDTLDGNAGSDWLSYWSRSTGVAVNLDPGTPAFPDGESPANFERVIGGSGADTLTGSSSANTLVGAAGNDILSGGSGSDLLIGDANSDSITGGPGNDTLRGGLGTDTISGGGNDDLLDYLNEGRSTGVVLEDAINDIETIYGTDLNDTLNGTAGSNTIFGLGGNDSIHGGDGADLLIGDDQSWGAAGNDTLDGGLADDILSGGRNSDWLIGGDGIDQVDFFYEGRSSGVNAIIGGIGEDTIGSDVEWLHGSSSPDNLSVLTSLTGSYQLTGNGGNDVITGGKGNDYLEGTGGDDCVRGNGGNDTVTGGSGNDALFGDMAYGQSIDGAFGSDSINAGPHNDVLRGHSGADTLDGGDGNDLLYGEMGPGETINANPGDDHDTIIDIAGTNTINGGYGFNKLDLSAANSSLSITINTAAIANVQWVIGGSQNDTITVNASSDPVVRFEGRGGNDSLVGSNQDDTLIGDAGNDTLRGGSGNDLLQGDDAIGEQSGNDSIAADAGDDTVFGGLGVDSITGSEGKDVIDPGDGNDSLMVDSSTTWIEQSGRFRVVDDVTSAASPGESFAVAGPSSSNVIVTANYRVPDGQWVGLFARYETGASSYYLAAVGSDGSVEITRKASGGSATTVASKPGGTAPAQGLLRFEANGGVLRVFINDEFVLSYTDGSPLASGSTGIYADTTGSTPLSNSMASISNYSVAAVGSVSNGIVMVPSNSAPRATAWNPGITLNPADLRVGDFNGDRRSDIIGREASGTTWYVGVSSGLSAVTKQFNGISGTDSWSGTWQHITAADFNGDGLTDLAAQATSGGAWKVSLSTGSAFQTSSDFWTTSGSVPVEQRTVSWTSRTFIGVMDVNGDRRADLVSYSSSGGSTTIHVAESTGTGFLESTWASVTGVSWANPVVGDFDGDGRKEFAMRDSTGSWRVGLSQGTKFIGLDTAWGGGWSSPTGAWFDVLVGDFNADGLDDIVGRSTGTSTSWKVAISSGSSFTSQTRTGDDNLTDVKPADLNGDGATDLFGIRSGTYRAQLSSTSNIPPAYAAPYTAFSPIDWIPNGAPAVTPSSQPVLVGDFLNQKRAAAAALEGVYNNIRFEPYGGSMKNPQQALETKTGNSWDQAALLIEELSQSGIRAIFETLQLRVPLNTGPMAANVANWLGVRNIASAYSLLTQTGMVAFVDTASGPSESWVPYNNHVLNQIDEFTVIHAVANAYLPGPGGNAWVRMDPTWKLRDLHSGSSILHIPNSVPYNDTGTGGYLKIASASLADEFYRDQVAAWLPANQPGVSLADLAYTGPIIARQFASLPTVLDYPSFIGPADLHHVSIPQIFKHRTLVTVSDAEGPVLTASLSIPDVADQPLLITWATTSGGQLLAQLRLGSVVLHQAALTDAVAPATPITVTIEQLKDGVASNGRLYNYSRKAGQNMAIGLDTGQISDGALLRMQGKLNDLANRVSVGTASATDYQNLLLAYGEAKFLHDFRDRVYEIADLTGMRFAHRVAWSGLMTAIGSQETNWTLSHTIFPGALTTDNPQITTLMVPQDGALSWPDTTNPATAVGQAYKIVGHTFSGLEHHIIEEIGNADAVSAVRGIQWAYANGVNVITINPGGSTSSLQLEAAAITNIQTALANGWTVVVPVDEVTIGSGANQWTGAVWIQTTSDSNGSGFGYLIQKNGEAVAHGSAKTKDSTPNPFKVDGPLFTVGGDPVTMATGNLTHDEVDISMPGVGLPVTFKRHYDSLFAADIDGDGQADPNSDKADRGLGVGWMGTFFDYLTISGSGGSTKVTWHTSDGLHHTFTGASGTLSNPKGLFGTFQVDGAGYKYTDTNGTKYRFKLVGPDYRLDFIEDRHQNLLQCHYNGTELDYVVDGNTAPGRNWRLNFTYTGGHVTSIEDFSNANGSGNGRVWTYTYDPMIDSTTGTTKQYLVSMTTPPVTLGGADPLHMNYTYYSGGLFHGLMKTSTDPDHPSGAAATIYTYYPSRRAYSVTDPAGSTEYFRFDPYHKLGEYTNAEGQTTITRFNAEGLTLKVINADRTQKTNAWESTTNLLTSTTDELGRTESYEYYTALEDPRRNLKEYTAKDGVKTTYGTYHPVSNVPASVTVSKGGASRQTIYGRNTTTGNIESITDNANNITTYTYETDTTKKGLVKTITRPRGNLPGVNAAAYRTTYTYNDVGQVTELIEAAGLSAEVKTKNFYDPFGRGFLVEVQDPTHSTTSIETFYAYDNLGSLTTTTRPEPYSSVGTIITSTVYKDSLPISTKDARGYVSLQTYDPNGRVIRATNPDGTFTTTTYDAIGNVLSTTDELGRKTQFFYDSRNRLIQVLGPDGVLERIWYDGAGRIVATIDANSNKSSKTYDSGDRIKSVVTDAIGELTTYDYLDLGDPKWETTEPSGSDYYRRTYYKTDLLGRVSQILVGSKHSTISTVDNIHSLTTIDYDQNGNVRDRVQYDVGSYVYDRDGGYSGGSPLELPSDPRTLSANLKRFDTTVYDFLDRPIATATAGQGATLSVANNTTTVTVSLSSHGLVSGNRVVITGNTETWLNGEYVITTQGSHQFTYTLPVNAPEQLTNAPRIVLPNVKSTSYDKGGRVVTTTDERGAVTKNGYDGAGRLNWVAQPLPTTGAVYTGSTPDQNSAWPTVICTLDKNGNQTGIKDARIKDTLFAYDTLNRMVKQTQHSVTISVAGTDTTGNPVSRTVYDAAGQVVSTIDANGNAVYNVYDRQGRQTSQHLPRYTDAAGTLKPVVTRSEYDQAGNTISSTDANSNKTTFTYDALNRLKETLSPDPDGPGSNNPAHKTINAYSHNDLTEVLVRNAATNAILDETDYTYDVVGRKLTETLTDPDASGSGNPRPVTTWTYDTLGNIKTLKTPELTGTSEVYTFQYDPMNRKIKEIQPQVSVDVGGGSMQSKNPTITYTYDAAGNLKSTTDALGNLPGGSNPDPNFLHTTSYDYDFLGRKKSETGPDPDTASSGKPRPVTTYTFDKNGNIETITPPRGNETATPAKYQTTYAYDALNRKTTETLPDPDDGGSLTSPITKYKYDAVGNLTAIVNPPGNVLGATPSHYSEITLYDALNRKIRHDLADPDGGGYQTAPSTAYVYDANGNLVKVTDPLGNSTTYTYDTWNRQTGETTAIPNPSGGTQNVTRTTIYDAAGNAEREIDRQGRLRKFTYDALHRKTTEEWAPTQAGTLTQYAIWTYNDKGQLASARNLATDGTTVLTKYNYTYNNLGWVTDIGFTGSTVLPEELAQRHRYDVAGRRTQTEIEDTTVQYDLQHNTYTYDNLGHVLTVSQNNSGLSPNVPVDIAARFTYDSDGNLKTIERFSDSTFNSSSEVATSDYTYDFIGRLKDLTQYKENSGAGWLADYELTYDVDGRITFADFQAGPGIDRAYTYDNNDQLLSEPSKGWAYDSNGNRVGYTVAADNRITSDGIQGYTYIYDNEGNLTKRTRTATGDYEDYEYDHLNRLISVTSKNSNSPANPDTTYEKVTFTYDVNGRRIRKEVDVDGSGGAADVIERYIYDGENIAVALDGTLNAREYFLFRPGIDQILAEQEGSGTNWTVDWSLQDWLGTVRRTVTNSGITRFIEYDASGNVTGTSGFEQTMTYQPPGGSWPMDGEYIELGGESSHWSATGTGPFTVYAGGSGNPGFALNNYYSPDLVVVYDWTYGNMSMDFNYSESRFEIVLADDAIILDLGGAFNDYEFDYYPILVRDVSDNKSHLIDWNGYSSFTFGGLTAGGFTVTGSGISAGDMYGRNWVDGSGYADLVVGVAGVWSGLTADASWPTGPFQAPSPVNTTAYNTPVYNTGPDVGYSDVLNAPMGPDGAGIQFTSWSSRGLGLVMGANDSITVSENANEYVVTIPDSAILIRDTAGFFGSTWGKPIVLRNPSGSKSFTLTSSYTSVAAMETGGFDTRDWSDGISADELRARGWVNGSNQAQVKLAATASGAGAGAYIAATLTMPTKLPRFTYTGREFDGETGLYNYRARYYDAKTARFISQDPKSFDGGDTNLYRYVGNSTPNLTDPMGMMAVAGQRGVTAPGTLTVRGSSAMDTFARWNAAGMLAATPPGVTSLNPANRDRVGPDRPDYEREVLIRGGGLIQATGGSIEAGLGYFGLMTTSPTVVGAFVSSVALLHGTDTAVAGVRTFVSGGHRSTLTAYGIGRVTGNQTAGQVADAILGVGLTFGAGMAAQSGRVSAFGGMDTFSSGPTTSRILGGIDEFSNFGGGRLIPMANSGTPLVSGVSFANSLTLASSSASAIHGRVVANITNSQVGTRASNFNRYLLRESAVFGTEESAENIIARVAQQQANLGPSGLRLHMSPSEWAAFSADPEAGSRFLGTAVHNATRDALQESHPGRFLYNRVGPDFIDTTTGGMIELTTPGQVGAHIARGGDYTGAAFSRYTLSLTP